jgi:hypothetical protein
VMSLVAGDVGEYSESVDNDSNGGNRGG